MTKRHSASAHYIVGPFVYCKEFEVVSRKTKKNKKEKSNSKIEEVDLLTDGGVCITSNLSLFLYSLHAFGANSSSPDPSR